MKTFLSNTGRFFFELDFELDLSMNGPTLINGSFSDNFFPFSLTRSVADIRVGILTIREKWQWLLKNRQPSASWVSIPSNIIPDFAFIESISEGRFDEAMENAIRLDSITDILRLNDSQIKSDFRLITSGRSTAPVSTTNKITGENIFLENGAVVEHCFLNATAGPIYIGKESLIMEGSMIRGPFAMGEKSVVKMGTRIYGATSAGPACVLGGEIKNSILFGYSNKAHDGYLGDSIIGEWCNIGGGSTNSNMKNSLGSVKLHNPLTKSFSDAGLKCGLMMGDYSRSAINTSFNTGAVVGISCHVFGNGLSPAYLPSFSWGFHGDVYSFEKAIKHIAGWKKLKNKDLTEDEINKLKSIFDQQNQTK